MIMRKNERFSTAKTPKAQLFEPLTRLLLGGGMLLIFASLFALLLHIEQTPTYSPATATRFGKMLEYPVAALAALTALSFLFDRVMKDQK